jgi:hypothetical protein
MMEEDKIDKMYSEMIDKDVPTLKVASSHLRIIVLDNQRSSSTCLI